MAPPRPLLDILRELNEGREGAPSHWLKEMRAATAGWQKYKETAQGRELSETMRRIQESGLAERLMGRMRPVTPLRPDSTFVKRKRGTGRKPSLMPEQIRQGIRILRDQPRMKVEAACATLKEAGIKTSNSALYRLVVQPAYAD
jgi:hypothetical protein